MRVPTRNRKPEPVLKLRKGVVVEAGDGGSLVVDVDGERRRAWGDIASVGPSEPGDDVVVNTAALDLGLGSGGFDIVHVNLTRGLTQGEVSSGVHVMKLNYSSLQHAVEPIELPVDSPALPTRRIPVAVLPLHGHLAPLAWAYGQAASRGGGSASRLGFIQAGGGALPGGLSRDLATLLERGLVAEAVSASPSYGGTDAISLIGAIHAASERLGWDAAIVGPGPGILGSGTRYGHGGMAALDGAHAALSLRMPTLISPRMSSGDPRPRHLGLSHHTRSVLDLMLARAEVVVPEGLADLWPQAAETGAGEALAAIASRHELIEEMADLDGYARAALPSRTMGRPIADDELFFAAALAAGEGLHRQVA